MQITEKDFKQYFPKDNRFLHFCAKYYGLSFYNEEVVEEASFQALKNVMRLYERKQEFEDEAQKTGMVMSSFRFGIYAAYDQLRRRQRLDSRPMTDFQHSDDDEYNTVHNKMRSEDVEFDNTMDTLNDFIDNKLTWLEKIAVREHIIGGDSYAILSRRYDVTGNAIVYAKKKAIKKLREYVSKIEPSNQEELNRPKYISEARSKLRIEALLEPIKAEQEERNRYSKALSFVYLDE